MTVSTLNGVRHGPTLNWWRLGGLPGIAWVVLFIVGGVVLQGEPPAFVSFIGLAIWVVLTSISMLLRADAPAVAARRGPR